MYNPPGVFRCAKRSGCQCPPDSHESSTSQKPTAGAHLGEGWNKWNVTERSWEVLKHWSVHTSEPVIACVCALQAFAKTWVLIILVWNFRFKWWTEVTPCKSREAATLKCNQHKIICKSEESVMPWACHVLKWRRWPRGLPKWFWLKVSLVSRHVNYRNP